ncbi:MAG TPA: hypothetical protein VK448_01335 [Dissulfurispiraceae bacterium]|nr:hypothetical protein [Dissulfurispiraceae bacterium]
MAVWIGVAILVLIIQPKLSLFEYPLNLSVVVVYAFAIRQSMQQSAAVGSGDVSTEIKATIFGAVVGLLEDGMSGSAIGPNLLGKGLVGLMSSFVFRDIFFQWDSSLGSIVLCILTIADGLIVIGLRLLVFNAVVSGWATAELIAMQAIMNIPLGLLIKPGQKEAAERSWFQKRRYN